jgi:hypothetical protein
VGKGRGFVNIKTLKINGFEYEVQYHDDLGGDMVGNIDYVEGIINVEKHSNKGMLLTILHEAVHGILFSAGLNNVDDDEHDERIVQAMAHGIYTLIKDNPKLVELIKKG